MSLPLPDVSMPANAEEGMAALLEAANVHFGLEQGQARAATTGGLGSGRRICQSSSPPCWRRCEPEEKERREVRRQSNAKALVTSITRA